MLQPEFFRLFRLFVHREFFDPETCARLRAELRAGECRPLGVHDGTAIHFDEMSRRTKRVYVEEQAADWVRQRVLCLRSVLAEHFCMNLCGCQRPQFLAYGEGDFFSRHEDSNPASADPHIQQRRLSVVIFLNGWSDSPREDCFGGGALTFHGLLKDPRTQNMGLPLNGEAGMLVAFPSGLCHSVSPVTHGERHTIVTWFV